MKSLVLLSALCGIWMSVEGASVITPDSHLWSDSSMSEFQNECVSKIQNNTNVVIDAINIKFSFLSVFIKLTQNIRLKNSLESLDSMISDICLPAIDEEKLYSLTMQIAKVCMNQDDPFSEEEKQIIKNKLERIVCNLYMKLAAIITFSPDCLSDARKLSEITKCAQGRSLINSTPVREWFFGNSEMCTTQSKAVDCVNQVIREHCDATMSRRIESVLAESQSFFGCVSEPNSIVINSL